MKKILFIILTITFSINSSNTNRNQNQNQKNESNNEIINKNNITPKNKNPKNILNILIFKQKEDKNK